MSTRIFLLLLLLIANSTFCVYAQNNINLNGTWRFALAQTDKEAEGLSEFYVPGFKSNKLQSVPVPSNWEILGFEEPVYRGYPDDKGSEGFYLREFEIPADWNKKRVLLHFGGVWSSAEVWLNGTHLGQHNSGYTSFAFDVSRALKKKGTNVLAVRVRQVSREYKFDTFDDWTLAGIYRDVTLEAMPSNRWLDQVTTQTVFDKNYDDADLKVRVMVNDRNKQTIPGNYPTPGEPYHLRLTLSDKEGNSVAARTIEVPAHTSTGRDISLTFRVESPKHWTAETPYLYTLKAELLENDQAIHSRVEKIGFREISTEGGVFRINGQTVKLRGVNRHDEHPDVGRATRHEHWLEDIMKMKEANINYVRTAHYTHAKGFIELCDELGMYVGSEVSLGGAGHLREDPSYMDAALVRTYETITRDINSPSIVYWSVGNEDPLTSFHLTSIKVLKALDSTRPVLIPWRHESWLPEEIDILSAHYWQPHEYDTFAAQANRPIITTEYTHAYGTEGFGGLEARWKALTRHPAGAGGAIWMWADQGIKTPTIRPDKKYDNIVRDDKYMRIDAAGWDGIVDSYRNKTRDFWEVKAVYAQVYPVVDKMEFTPGQSTVRIPIQNDFDFTDLNNIKIDWSLREDDKTLASGTSTINGKPHAEGVFDLPIKEIKRVTQGKTYYAWFIFTGADGQEITRKAVELCPLNIPDNLLDGKEHIVLTKDEMTTVDVGNVRYVFNPMTGHLVSAALHHNLLITELTPTLWEKPDHGAASVIGNKLIRYIPDMNRNTPSVKSWNISEEADKVTIDAKVEYIVNDTTSFTTDYQYTISTDGRLNVRYEILPKVFAPSLPIVGMSLKTMPEMNNIRWLGLGPWNAYPNKRSAPILGVWGGETGSADVIGKKATRWIERSGSVGGVHISHVGYMGHNAASPDVINILSEVLSKPEKGRKPDDSFPLLLTDTGEPFIGEFGISLK